MLDAELGSTARGRGLQILTANLAQHGIVSSSTRRHILAQEELIRARATSR